MRENLKFLFSLVILISLMFGCGKLSELGGGSTNKLFFCESYTPDNDKCEGKSTKYPEGFLTVVVDIRPSKAKIGVSSVNINITDLGSGTVADTYPYTTDPTMDYVYFDKVDFKKPGKYKVSALKPDGTVIASSEIEIIELIIDS
ncbi:MAG: hypothetical protein IPL53_11085 [Ignavibacteria bacterium]|nr:hypothetical protein [Ignavibacteria bacterium]